MTLDSFKPETAPELDLDEELLAALTVAKEATEATKNLVNCIVDRFIINSLKDKPSDFGGQSCCLLYIRGISNRGLCDTLIIPNIISPIVRMSLIAITKKGIRSKKGKKKKKSN